MALLPGAEPFFLPGGATGCLLVHGFTGSPSEMRLLGEHLQRRGFTVLAPRLCGHGTTPEEMARTGHVHWYSAVVDGYLLLRSLCAHVFVVGLSMGGLLAAKLASEYNAAGLVLLNTPIYIQDRRLVFLPIYRLFRRFVTKKRRFLPVDPCYCVHYDRTPLAGVSSLLDLIKEVQRLLPVITTPALIVQSQADHTVRPDSAVYIYDHLGGKSKRLVWCKHSGHIITLDSEREQIFALVENFLRRSDNNAT